MPQKGPDEIFCRSCGEPIKKAAEICPECGVRNEGGGATNHQQSSGKAASTTPHDPSKYETTVSDTWWYGVAAGVGLWIVVFLTASMGVTGSTETFMGLVALVAWAIMPIAAYFDMKYIRANSTWRPSTAIWIIAMIVWLVNIVAGVVYLYRRHETLGEP